MKRVDIILFGMDKYLQVLQKASLTGRRITLDVPASKCMWFVSDEMLLVLVGHVYPTGAFMVFC